MKKLKSDELFDLIKSLTKNEKLFFYKYAQRHVGKRQNNYLTLFKIMDNMSFYNEEKLKQLVQKEEFSGYLPRLKKYLYDTILDSLKENVGSSLPAIEIRNYIIKTELLFRRQLFHQAAAQVKKARELAEQYQYMILLLDVIRWEILIGYETNNPKNYIDFHQNKLLEMEATYQVLREYETIDQIGMGMVYMLNLKYTENINHVFYSFMNHPVLKKKPEEYSNLHRRQCRAAIDQFIQTYQLMQHDIAPELTAPKAPEFEKFDVLTIQNKSSHLTAVKNHVYDCILENNMGAAFKALDEINEFLTEEEKNSDQTIYRINYFDYHVLYLHAASACKRTDKIETVYQNAVDLLNSSTLDKKFGMIRRIELYFSIALYSYTDEKNKDALRILTRLLNTKEFEDHALYLKAMILNLLIHYDLENSEYMEYIIKKIKQYYNYNESATDTLSLLLTLFTEIAKDNDFNPRKLVPLFQKLHQSLSVPKAKLHLKRFEPLDLLSWLEAKINGKKYIEIMADKIY